MLIQKQLFLDCLFNQNIAMSYVILWAAEQGENKQWKRLSNKDRVNIRIFNSFSLSMGHTHSDTAIFTRQIQPIIGRVK